MKSKENYSGFKGVFKFISNVFSWTILVIVIILACFLAYYTINSRLHGKDFKPFISLYKIVSGSMEPNIKIYDVVISKKVNSPKDIKVGDVITFISSSPLTRGYTITHRVIEVTNTEKGYVYKTKGDNNLTPDASPAEFNKILGKVIIKIPQLGRLQEFISTQSGWLLVIVLPALVIIITDILKIFKLVGVKNQIEKIDEDNKRIKNVRAEKEALRKEEIKKRLKLEKSIHEPDPIVTKKTTRVVVGFKALESSEPVKNRATSTNKGAKNNNINYRRKKRKSKR